MHTDNFGKYYLEWYEPSKGGVYASSIRTCFFTDSLNNRIFIASCHDDEDIDEIYDSNYFIFLKYSTKNSYIYSKTFKDYIDTIIVNTKNMIILNKNDMIYNNLVIETDSNDNKNFNIKDNEHQTK